MYSKIFLIAWLLMSFTSIASAQSTSTSKKKIRNPAVTANPIENVTVTKSSNLPSDKSTFNAALTEFAYQPMSGHVAFTATPKISNQSVTTLLRGSSRDSTTDTRTNLIGLSVQRGLDNNLSWSAEAGFGNQDVDYEGQRTSQSKGITDITLGLRQLREVPAGQMFYGAQASLSPGDQEISYAYRGGRSGDGNLYSGGHTLSPFVGMQMDRRSFLVGGVARLDYHFDRVQTGRNADNSKVTLDSRGGHVASLEAFVERPTPSVLFGAKAGLGVATSADMDYESGLNRRDFSTGSYQVFAAGIYAKFSPGSAKNLAILPSLSLAKTMGSSGGSLSQQENQSVSFGLAVRGAL